MDGWMEVSVISLTPEQMKLMNKPLCYITDTTIIPEENRFDTVF